MPSSRHTCRAMKHGCVRHGRRQLDSWVFPGIPKNFANTSSIYYSYTYIYLFGKLFFFSQANQSIIPFLDPIFSSSSQSTLLIN
jgi:hypothetical protein